LTLELKGQTRTIFIDQLRGDRSHSSLPVLSPAVELAAYRIASEAINKADTRCWASVDLGASRGTGWNRCRRADRRRMGSARTTAARTGSHHPSTITLLGVDPLACLAAPADRYLTDHERL
jgi:hypothetical protein